MVGSAAQASFFALALPFHSFEHPFSRRWPLDHLRCALWQWLLLCHMPLRLVHGDNSLGTAKWLRCRLDQIGADSLSANIDTAAVTRAACEGQISALVLRPFPLEPTRRVIQETGNMMVLLWKMVLSPAKMATSLVKMLLSI